MENNRNKESVGIRANTWHQPGMKPYRAQSNSQWHCTATLARVQTAECNCSQLSVINRYRSYHVHHAAAAAVQKHRKLCL